MNLHVINLGMVNVYLLGDQDYIMIDTGMKQHADKIIDYMAAHEIKPDQVKLIVLTHSHEDHVGGLKKLQSHTGADIAMHLLEYNCATLKEADEITPLSWMAKVIFFLSRNVEVKPFDMPVDHVFKETFDLTPFGVEGRIVHTPGHTKGSVSVLVDKKAFIGDSIMALLPWSKPKRPVLAYDLNLIKSSMDKLLSMGIQEFYCSHGKSYTAKEIEKALRSL